MKRSALVWAVGLANAPVSGMHEIFSRGVNSRLL